MSRIKSTDVSVKDYIIIKDNYLNSGKHINEQFFGSRKTLFDENNNVIATNVQNNTIDIGKLSKQQFFSFLGLFNKHLYGNIRKNPKLLDLEVNFSGMSRKKNHTEFYKLETGDFFYNLDLNSAYWQIVYKLGYIDKSFYTKYQNLDEYKVVKRLCISFLARPNKKNYYINDEEVTINCDNSSLKQIYSNIRNTLYTIFTTASKEVNYIAYNIDSIYIKKEDLEKVKKIFNDLSLDYKLILCQKVDDLEYTYGSDRRKF